MGISRSEADAVISELARGQFGVVHRRQLLERELTYRQIEHRVDHHELIELGNGVYAIPSAPPTYLRQYKAAELSIPDAALCSLAASKLHDLGATRSAAPEIVVHPSANHRCVFGRVHRRREVDVTSVKGIRVTTVAQTLIDLTPRLRLTKLDDVWTSALIRNRCEVAELEDRVRAAEVQRLAHRGLARAVLDALVHGVEEAESELEALLFDIASTVSGIPPLKRQIALPWWRSGTGRGDVGVPAWRLILEADGRSWHARATDFDDDRMRDNLAVANGWGVLRFSAVHLRRMPGQVADTIAAAGQHRRTA